MENKLMQKMIGVFYHRDDAKASLSRYCEQNQDGGAFAVVVLKEGDTEHTEHCVLVDGVPICVKLPTTLEGAIQQLFSDLKVSVGSTIYAEKEGELTIRKIEINEDGVFFVPEENLDWCIRASDFGRAWKTEKY